MIESSSTDVSVQPHMMAEQIALQQEGESHPNADSHLFSLPSVEEMQRDVANATCELQLAYIPRAGNEDTEQIVTADAENIEKKVRLPAYVFI